MDEMSEFVEEMNNWGLSVNARIKFYDFINAVESTSGLVDECQKIYQIIDDIVLDKESTQFVKQVHVGSKYYRARIINPKDDYETKTGISRTRGGKYKGYNDINSREPMIGISGEGRNNVTGVSYLYLASNPETACMEVKSQFGDLLSLATFELVDNFKIIDFSTDKDFKREHAKIHNLSLGVFFTLLMMRYCEPVRENNAYKATQIISDYLRKTGVDGIAYKSFLSPGGVNYTFFNCHPSRIKFCESRVVIHKQANHSFWDFNNETEIMSNKEMKLMKYDKEIAKKHREHLNQRFKIIEEI